MNFLSALFLIFLGVTYLLWRLLPFRYARWVLLGASLLFYAYAYPPFLIALITCGMIIYLCAYKVETQPGAAKGWFLAGILLVLAGLLFFKAAHPLMALFMRLPKISGGGLEASSIDILYPVGLSFYSFRGLGYLIDVYKKKITPCNNLIDYLIFFSFFGQVMAGPICRAKVFFETYGNRKLEYSDWAYILYRFSRGAFLKICIADQLAVTIHRIFSYSYASSPVTAWAGAVLFTIQIFCDFCGYSDIALSVSRLFGIRLPENFLNPYLAKNLNDFWGRWHISLTTWFRDYVYYPMATSGWMRRLVYTPLKKVGVNQQIVSSIPLMLMFTLSGFWHGTGSHYILWGLLHGIGASIEKVFGTYQRLREKRWGGFIAYCSTLLFVILVWVPFRAGSLKESVLYLGAMFNWVNLKPAEDLSAGLMVIFIGFILFLVLCKVKEVKRWDELAWISKVESWIYFILVLITPMEIVDFVYFRF